MASQAESNPNAALASTGSIDHTQGKYYILICICKKTLFSIQYLSVSLLLHQYRWVAKIIKHERTLYCTALLLHIGLMEQYLDIVFVNLILEAAVDQRTRRFPVAACNVE